MIKRLFTYMLLSTALVACDNGWFVDKMPTNTPTENFELMWRALDERYCYFDEKQVDWDSIYTHFRPQISDTMSSASLFSQMCQMLDNLRDGHVNLLSPEHGTYSWPGFATRPTNFSKALMEKYLGEQPIRSGELYAQKIGNIGYIYSPSMKDNGGPDMLRVLRMLSPTAGLILDIRNNEGGDVSTSYGYAAHFFDHRTRVLYTKSKKGKGHNDFTTPVATHIDPSSSYIYPGHVVLLTNRKSYSAANLFAVMMREAPRVVLMGDQTGGGGGFPYEYSLINGWGIRFSAVPNYDANMNSVEEGIAPNYLVKLVSADQIKGVDTLIEAALALLSTKN